MAAYDLDRFKKAQEHDYALALEEIKEGRKRSHWIWYIFPQVKGLGFSGMSEYYGIEGVEEAKCYLQDSLLRSRLLEITQTLLKLQGKTATQVFGYPDDLKVRSCMTLFSLAAPEEEAFQKVLDQYYDGKPDEMTIRMVQMGSDH